MTRAAWYPDPYSFQPQLRYWNGKEFSSHETEPLDTWFERLIAFGGLGLPRTVLIRRRHCPQCGIDMPRSRPWATFCSDDCSHAHQLSVAEWAHGGPKPQRVGRWFR